VKSSRSASHTALSVDAGPRPHLRRDRAHPCHICAGTRADVGSFAVHPAVAHAPTTEESMMDLKFKIGIAEDYLRKEEARKKVQY